MEKATKQTEIRDGPARIAIVDDHPMLRSGLRELISHEQDLEVCGEAHDAATAYEQIDATKPDLIIVDIALHDCNGLELVKQIKAQHESLKVLVCSMYDDSLYAERAIKAGALGYIKKERAVDEVILAIRKVLSDHIYLSDHVSERILRRVTPGESEPESRPIDTLTDRELEAFELFGRGLSSEEIAERMHLSRKTVDAHRQKIKQKLNIETTNELIQRAVQWVLHDANNN